MPTRWSKTQSQYLVFSQENIFSTCKSEDGKRQRLNTLYSRRRQQEDTHQVDHVQQTVVQVLGDSKDSATGIQHPSRRCRLASELRGSHSAEATLVKDQAEGNLSPDHLLSNAREKISTETGYGTMVSRPGVSASGHPAPNCKEFTL